MDTCTFEACTGKYYARGLCKKHWMRWRRHGHPAIKLSPPGAPRRETWEEVNNAYAKQMNEAK